MLLLCGDKGIPILGPSGASAHLRSVARALSRRGEVVVATPRASDHRGIAAELAVPWVGFEPRSWRWLRGWRERGETWDARALAERAVGGATSIWERHSLFVDAGNRLQERLGIPRVVELNAPLSLERPGIFDLAYARRIERASLRAADRVLAVSPWLERWAIEAIGCAPERVLLLPNGSEVRPGDADRARAKHGLDGPIAAWIGSCKRWHGLHRLADLADALPDWTIAVAGSGPEPIPAHPRIRALGRLEGADLDDLLAAAAVGLSTGDPDRMPWVCPLKIADYRAAGLPVITTASGASAVLVDRGAVVDPWTAEGAAASVREWATAERVPRIGTWDDVVEAALSGL